MMFRSAALRLTLWYLLIIMFVSMSFSFVLYWALQSELDINIGNQVRFIEDSPRFNGQQPGQAVRPDAPQTPQVQPSGRPSFEEVRRRQLDDSSRKIRERLLQINLIILLLGAGASYLLARRTLSPIQDALDAQSRFTADASHELRTPLTAMRSEIEVALREKRPSLKDRNALLGSNLEEIAKLEDLSARLLRLADYENGTEKLTLKPTKVRPALDAALKRLNTQAKRRHVAVSITAPKSITVPADRDRLTELFTILIDNAVKYSHDSGSVKVVAKNIRGKVRVTVADRGIGIKASDIPFLFNRFYRADSSRSRRTVEGYGLGLAMAKHITDLHHGSIEVASQPNRGSTFTVTLPIAKK